MKISGRVIHPLYKWDALEHEVYIFTPIDLSEEANKLENCCSNIRPVLAITVTLLNYA